VGFHTRKNEEIPCDLWWSEANIGNFYDHREI
jgi:hypothetical protein